MNTQLKDVIAAAEQLPETDQRELAAQIENLIVERKIAAAEADIASGQTAPLDEAFQRILDRLTA